MTQFTKEQIQEAIEDLQHIVTYHGDELEQDYVGDSIFKVSTARVALWALKSHQQDED